MPHITRPEIEESKNRISTVIKIVSKSNFTQKEIVKHELNQVLTILQGK